MFRCSVYFYFFLRQELMYLDLRCDTRMCGSQSESYCNHTNGIQRKHHASLKLSHFHCHLHCPLLPGMAANKQWDFHRGQLNHPSLTKKGNKGPPLPSPDRKPRQEAGNGEFVCCFNFFSDIPNLFSPQPILI